MTISPKRLEAIQSIPDSEIDTSDIPELDDSFWNEAKLHMPRTKQPISIRVDTEENRLEPQQSDNFS